MNTWTRLHRFVDRLAAMACRHPQGMVCEHRAFNYDPWYRGYLGGFDAGKANMEAKWLGNVSRGGPYANYPAPTPREWTDD